MTLRPVKLEIRIDGRLAVWGELTERNVNEVGALLGDFADYFNQLGRCTIVLSDGNLVVGKRFPQ